MTDQKQFNEDLAVDLYRAGWKDFHDGKPLSAISSLSSRSGWKDAKRVAQKQEKVS